jgi:DNA-directed RNA polymerase subunit RPC12/RpoP
MAKKISMKKVKELRKEKVLHTGITKQLSGHYKCKDCGSENIDVAPLVVFVPGAGKKDYGIECLDCHSIYNWKGHYSHGMV